jgi:hypothetical protein
MRTVLYTHRAPLLLLCLLLLQKRYEYYRRHMSNFHFHSHCSANSIERLHVIIHQCISVSHFMQLSRNAFKNWVKQLAVKDHWASSKVIL